MPVLAFFWWYWLEGNEGGHFGGHISIGSIILFLVQMLPWGDGERDGNESDISEFPDA